MAQVTIYLDEITAHRVSAAAEGSGVSVSSWVRGTLERALGNQWPDRYFELFGALADSGLERPPQPQTDTDAPRAAL